MAFRRRRSTFRSSTGSLGWISWNRSGKNGTLGLGRCLRPLRGFRILGRTALEKLPDRLVEKYVSGRTVQAATSDGNRIDKGSWPMFTRCRRCGISTVLTRHKRFENSTARIGPRKRRLRKRSLHGLSYECQIADALTEPEEQVLNRAPRAPSSPAAYTFPDSLPRPRRPSI